MDRLPIKPSNSLQTYFKGWSQFGVNGIKIPLNRVVKGQILDDLLIFLAFLPRLAFEVNFSQENYLK